MQDSVANSPAGHGRTLLAVILVLVILVPVGYSVMTRVTAKAAEPPERPDPKVVATFFPNEYRCVVADRQTMRFHHWELLTGLREEVVRYGNRGDISLDGCWACHQSKVRFCDRCHHAASVHPDCFGCHYYPDLDKSRPLVSSSEPGKNRE